MRRDRTFLKVNERCKRICTEDGLARRIDTSGARSETLGIINGMRYLKLEVKTEGRLNASASFVAKSNPLNHGRKGDFNCVPRVLIDVAFITGTDSDDARVEERVNSLIGAATL
ncbi:furry homolog-like protein [Tanacetum coccineum]